MKTFSKIFESIKGNPPALRLYRYSMDQKEFNQILKRYLLGQASEEEIQFVEKWYASIDDASRSMGFIEKFLLKWRIRREVTNHMHNVRNSFPDFSVSESTFSWYWKISITVAAISALVVVYVFLVNPSNGKLVGSLAGGINEDIINNTETSDKIVLLADGSRVTLKPGSTIEVSESFNSVNREVYLKQGEGFFEVKRDVNRPFLVLTDKVVTKVLGTSFTVDASKPDIKVVVKTGKVSVFSKEVSNQPKFDEIILTPNQQAIYNSRDGIMSQSLIEQPSVVISEEDLNDMHFESADVPVVMKALSRAYGVEIEYDSVTLSSCKLTTFVDANEDLYKRLEIICQAIDATYNVDGVRVRISGGGCTQ